MEPDQQQLEKLAIRARRIMEIPLQDKIDCINKYIDNLNLGHEHIRSDMLGSHNGKLAQVDYLYSRINRPHSIGSIK